MIPSTPATRIRMVVAWIVVISTVVAVWKFVDYRNQPPRVPPPVKSDK